DDAANLRVLRRLEDVQRAGGADVMTGERVLDAALDGGEGGEVEDEFGPFDRGADDRGVGDGALDEVDVVAGGAQVIRVAGAKVVEDADLLPGGEQRVDQMRADEPSAPGHENLAHSRSPEN